MRAGLSRRVRAALTSALVALIALASAMFSVVAQAQAQGAASAPQAQSPASPDDEARAKALARASNAVIGVQVLAVEDATSNATLGRVRQGSGVVIGDEDLVLTIGYLIMEADQVQLVTDDQKVVPARVVAYDIATGFGLLRSLVPLKLEPVPFGDPSALSAEEPLMVVSGGENGGISLARMVSRRPFAGYWEYAIDNALFTVPARMDHSGAALFNSRGELMGIGSLFVMDALGPDQPRMPGNMFVPTELLKPILAELLERGSSAASRRAWLGVNCIERAGALHVMRVSNDSPADQAGLKPGDRIERIDGAEVHELDKLWQALWDGAPEREIVLEIRRGDQQQTLRLHSVDRMTMLKRARGI